jgi:23S rRNA pseudouridine2457 synthase
MHQYYIFYKPYQVLCQFSAEGDKVTLAHYLKDIPKDVYPVGRLDYDSEGLLLLTSDKALVGRLLEPRNAHERTYYVQVEGNVTPQALQQLRDGVDISIDGKKHRTRRARAELLPSPPQLPSRNPPVRFRLTIPTCWIALTLTEGKNRQVRRMTAAVGFPTLRLVRFAIGNVTLADMMEGEYRQAGADIVTQLLGKK